MSNPRRYSISILENYSDKSLHEIAIVIAQKVLTVQPENFVLQNTEDLDLGVEFLHTPDDPFSWMYINDLLPIFNNFRDTCFCLSVSDGECGGEHRSLFFNGKAIKQYPEIRYPEFHINDFEYQASDKTPLESDYGKLAAILKDVSEKKRSIEGAAGEVRALLDLPPLTADPVELDFIKKSFFGNIISENAQDA